MFFLLFIGLTFTLELTLSDIHYTSSHCGTIENKFGSLTIENDLMDRGIRMRINLDKATHRSCRLCQISNRYCNTTIEPTMALDTSFNLKVISLGDTVSSTSYSLQNSVSDINISPGRQCDTKHQWIILLIVNVAQPINHDFLLIANTTPVESVACDTTLVDISCSISPSYYYINYTTSNCLTMREDTDDGDVLQHQPLYYFHQTHNIPTLTLCGEQWSSLFQRSRLDLTCDLLLTLHIKQKPWYETAFITMSAYMNGRRDIVLWQTLELLEQTCSVRDHDVSLEDTVFYNMTQALRIKTPLYDSATICEWIGPVNKSNITMPAYIEYLNEWYFMPYQYILPADSSMPWKAPLLFSLPFVILFILSIATIITFYYIRRKDMDQYAMIT